VGGTGGPIFFIFIVEKEHGLCLRTDCFFRLCPALSVLLTTNPMSLVLDLIRYTIVNRSRRICCRQGKDLVVKKTHGPV
jgi:hypothetical protein